MLRLRRFRSDEDGQLHTMEGVVAGLMLVLTLVYVTGSITFLSPQTEKTTFTKLTIKAQDILIVLGSEDRTANYSSPLLRNIAAWKGGEGNSSCEVSPGEPSIAALYQTICSMLPNDVSYNLNITYKNSLGQMEDKVLIYRGEPHGNAASASKIIVLNKGDLAGLSPPPWWDSAQTPEAVEVQLVIWPI